MSPLSTAEYVVRLGVDLVAVERMERLVAENPDLLPTIFTARELDLCRHGRSIERMAGRLAAKEALLKALGAGLFSGVDLIDIEVDSSLSGRPIARLHGTAAAWADASHMGEAEVSISHSAGLAIAQALLLVKRHQAEKGE